MSDRRQKFWSRHFPNDSLRDLPELGSVWKMMDEVQGDEGMLSVKVGRASCCVWVVLRHKPIQADPQTNQLAFVQEPLSVTIEC